MTFRRPPVAVAALLACVPVGGIAQPPDTGPRVIPIHYLPSDVEFDPRHLRVNVQALADVQAWYSRSLGGATFHADPFLVLRSRYPFVELADTTVNWWGALTEELSDYGFRWAEAENYKVLVLAQAAGGWAGAQPVVGGLERPQDAGRVARGDRGGLALIGDSSVAGLLAGVCPYDGLDGGTVWWCNWDTYRGTIAHELGHTWGIPHPSDIDPETREGGRRWECAEHGETVMQCHWNFPYDSLLSYEAMHLRSLRFFVRSGARRRSITDLPPSERVGAVNIHRLEVGSPEPGVVWSEGWGEGVGFPWAVVIRDGSVRWTLPPGCRRIQGYVSKTRGAGGRGVGTIRVDGRTVRTDSATAGFPRAFAVPCGGETLELAVRGEARFQVVFGNVTLDFNPDQ